MTTPADSSQPEPAAESHQPERRARRTRMTSAARREQLIAISRAVFAERGFEGTTVEEIAARADVSKPIVYEHFGGKEGVYAVVVDREVRTLLTMMQSALKPGHPRELLQQAALALLDYIEASPDGFVIIVRDSPVGSSGTYVTIIGDVVSRVEDILIEEFKEHGYDTPLAPMYAQMLVGMVGATGQWWLDARQPSKEIVAAHLVNLAWNGLTGLEHDPSLKEYE
ncbi:TetR/AcrR family transcriptional regulator [Nocardioidaceae bacterium SCSIO 66511]|nr:TetR/AcrR family transcriptional regulator [Nocardioidaceae bacterium SCSIO 66511]